MPTQNTSISSFTRRRILGLGGAGAMGGLACYFGWPASETPQAPTVRARDKQTPAGQAGIQETAQATVAPSPGALRRDDFLPHLNSQFRLGSASGTCKLIEVGPARKLASPTTEYVSFSLLFAAPTGFLAESQIHPLSHEKMKTMELFISPVGQSKDHVYLEAVCCQRV
jgi:hypothetical protein